VKKIIEFLKLPNLIWCEWQALSLCSLAFEGFQLFWCSFAPSISRPGARVYCVMWRWWWWCWSDVKPPMQLPKHFLLSWKELTVAISKIFSSANCRAGHYAFRRQINLMPSGAPQLL